MMQAGNEQALLCQLSASGQYLTDPQGNVVILRGYNLCTKTAQTPEQLGFDGRNVALLQQQGVSVIRLGVPWANTQPYFLPNGDGSYQYDTQFLDSIKRTIQLLAQSGIYTLVDFHQDAFGAPWGFGAPSWAVNAGGSNTPQRGWPVNTFGGDQYVVDGAPLSVETDLNYAFDYFWNDVPIQPTDNAVTFWTAYGAMLNFVSGYLNDQQGNILGYDPLNEPEPGSQWIEGYVPPSNSTPNDIFDFSKGFPNFDATLRSFYEQCVIPNLHAGHPEAMIWYEPNIYFDYNAPTYLERVSGQNLGFNFHNYDSYNTENLFLDPVQHARSYSNDYTVPLLCSEFGGTPDMNDIQKVADINDEHMLSAIFWAWFNNARFNFAGGTNPMQMGVVQNMWQDPLQPNQEMLRILTRIYPLITAGTPMNFGTAGDGTFTFTYSTQLPNGQPGTGTTVIVVPTAIYPTANDYKATASGATVTQLAGSVQVIADSPLPPTITVTITPA
jgi:endoglycosylceramidase